MSRFKDSEEYENWKAERLKNPHQPEEPGQSPEPGRKSDNIIKKIHTRIEMAFENSPPLIPHDITGMLPIAQTDNICMGCHMPDESASSGATPIPKSHLFDLSTGKDLKGELDGTRFNCMQCHVIQTTVNPAIENLFKGEFRDEDDRHRSNLIDILNEGVE